MISDRYDTVVVPFPFDDAPVTKWRPALVLSGRTFNADNANTVFAMITTAKKSNWPSDVPIVDLSGAGLRVPCVIRWRLRTLPNELIARRLGRLSGRDRDSCGTVFAEAFS